MFLAGFLATLPIALSACRHEQPETGGSAIPPLRARASESNDLRFLDTMTAHHQRAVLMWQDAVTHASHRELRDFAAKAVEEQRREMFLIHLWRDRWFADAPSPAANSPTTASERPALPQIKGSSFDQQFLAMMVPHHQQAAAMARSAVTSVESPEIRQLAQIIVDQQEEEVKTMQRWTRAWFPPHSAAERRQ